MIASIRRDLVRLDARLNERRSRQRIGTFAWPTFGLLLAGAIVVVLLVFRPF